MFPLSREPALLQGSCCLGLSSSCFLWMEHGPSTLLQASVTPPPLTPDSSHKSFEYAGQNYRT